VLLNDANLGDRGGRPVENQQNWCHTMVVVKGQLFGDALSVRRRGGERAAAASEAAPSRLAVL
jgi:hypothetical protein